jgi:hypothetical protein
VCSTGRPGCLLDEEACRALLSDRMEVAVFFRCLIMSEPPYQTRWMKARFGSTSPSLPSFVRSFSLSSPQLYCIHSSARASIYASSQREQKKKKKSRAGQTTATPPFLPLPTSRALRYIPVSLPHPSLSLPPILLSPDFPTSPPDLRPPQPRPTSTPAVCH